MKKSQPRKLVLEALPENNTGAGGRQRPRGKVESFDALTKILNQMRETQAERNGGSQASGEG